MSKVSNRTSRLQPSFFDEYHIGLEVTRSALCMATRNSEQNALSAHVQRIASFARRIDSEIRVSEELQRLESIGEAQNLGNGYWTGTPSRFVSVANVRLVLSCNPTDALRSRCAAIETTLGLARITREQCELRFPTQRFDEWIGRTEELGEYARRHIEVAARNLRPTLAPTGIVRAYAPWVLRALGSRRLGGYVPIEELGKPFESDLHLCHIKSLPDRWIWARLEKGRIVEEAPVENDPVRLRFALDALHGLRTKLSPKVVGGQVSAVLHRKLPTEEGRALCALAHVTETDKTVLLHVNRADWDAVAHVLAQLGFDE